MILKLFFLNWNFLKNQSFKVNTNVVFFKLLEIESNFMEN